MSEPQRTSLADLVAAEKTAMVRSDAAGAAGLEELRASLAAGREAIVDVPPPAASGGGSTVLLAVLGGVVALGLAGAFVLGGNSEEGRTAVAAGVAEDRDEAEENERLGRADEELAEESIASIVEAEPVEHVPAQASAGTAVESPEPTEDEPAADESVREGKRKAPTRRRTKEPTRTPDETPSGDAFAEELRLLRKAKAASDAGHHEEAHRVLLRQAKRFPEGHFVEERSALQVLVLCDLGRADDAARARTRFFRDFPASPQTERVRSACE